MTRYMPVQVFLELARRGSIGLFTAVDKTTIFPEYEYLRDRPECEGSVKRGRYRLYSIGLT